jgi:hypothetical protein
MACPHVEYRETDGEQSFDTARAYCAVAERFVQPMRADICTERYGLDPAADCEIYRERAGLDWDEPGDGDAVRRADEREQSSTESTETSESAGGAESTGGSE